MQNAILLAAENFNVTLQICVNLPKRFSACYTLTIYLKKLLLTNGGWFSIFRSMQIYGIICKSFLLYKNLEKKKSFKFTSKTKRKLKNEESIRRLEYVSYKIV